MFDTAPVLESPPVVVKQVQPAPVVEYVTPASAVTYALVSLVVKYVTPAPTVAYASPVTTRTAATTVFPTVTVPISKLRQVPTEQTFAEARGDPTGEDLGQVDDLAVVVQRQVPMVWPCRRPVEIPQLQIWDMPVVVQRQVPTVLAMQKLWEMPQLHFIDEFVGIPVVSQRLI